MSNLTPLEQLALRPLLRVHDAVYRRTNGRIGHQVPGMPPSLLLHTTGAKTGRQRTTTLTYAQDGNSYLVVASNGGNDHYPGWYHNLRKRPDAEVNIGSRRIAVEARRVSPDNVDYSRLWALVNGNNADRYTGYQSRTSRPIPIFVLKPSQM
jgi:F420H(2)-dependent quinone reductase